MTNDILKFKNKPYWRYLDYVGERTRVVISDAENFPKFFINQDVDEDYIKKIRNEKYPELKDINFFGFCEGFGEDHREIPNYYSGYEVPLETNDVGVKVYGKVIDAPKNVLLEDIKKLSHILIQWSYYKHPYEFIDLINKGYELKKIKEHSIDIYSRKIGIGYEDNYGDHNLASAECICDCYLGNGTYHIFQIALEDKINPKSKDGPQNFGTLIELDSKENFTIKDVGDISLLTQPEWLK